MITAELYRALKSKVGIPTEPVTYDVEKGHIKIFAEATGDINPLWLDELEARKTRFGGVIAPPTYTEALLDRRRDDELVKDTRIVGGASEHQFLGVIRPGDRITVVSKLINVFQKPGSRGVLTFLVTETKFTNQFNETVVIRVDTGIAY